MAWPPFTTTARAPPATICSAAARISSRLATLRPTSTSVSARLGVTTVASGRMSWRKLSSASRCSNRSPLVSHHDRVHHQQLET